MPDNLPLNLPRLKAGWSWVKLGDVCEILDNKRVPINSDERDKRISGKPIEALFPYYGATGQVGFIDDYLLDGEFVLLGEDGAPFLEKNKPKAYIVNGKIWVNNHAHILLSRNNNRFLCYYLNFLDYHPFVTGTTRLKLNQSSMKQIPIINPPLPEQKKIVEKIEELFSELDRGVASLKKAKEQIRLYRQSVLAFAFSGQLVQEVDSRQSAVGKKEMLKAAEPKVDYSSGHPEFISGSEKLKQVQLDGISNQLPEGWKWVKLGEVIDSIQYGTSDKAVGSDKGIPVLRMGNIQDGKLDYSNLKYFDKNYEDLNKYLLDDSDLLFNRTNSAELVGKSALYKKHHPKSIFASYLIRVKVNKSIYLSELLNYYINSSYGRAFIKSVVSQNVGQANVNGTKLKSMSVPLIPLKQQTRIVEEIESRFAGSETLEKAIDDSLTKAEALRQSILKQAFEGKLV